MSKKTRISLITLISIMVGVFVLSYLVINKQTDAIDNMFYTIITTIYTNGIMLAAQVLSALGSPSVILAFSLIAVALFKDRRHKLAIIINTGFVYSITMALQRSIMRPLPTHMHFMDTVGFSFPSVYVSLATIFYGVVIMCLLKGIKKGYLRTILISSYSILILLIGLARTYTGADHLTDVIAGYGIAIIGFLIMRLIFNLIRFLLQKSMLEEKSNKQDIADQ